MNQIISISHGQQYTVDEIMSITGLNMVQIQYWIKKKDIPFENGKIQGSYVTQMIYWQEEKDINDSKPRTPREEFVKLSQLLVNMRNSSRASLLFGDYQVNEMSMDLVDLLSRFINSQSVRRIKASKEEIKERICEAWNRDPEGDNTDFSEFEGNLTEEDAATFYRKLMEFRVMRQGREVMTERFKKRLLEDIHEDENDCMVEYTDEADGVVRVKLAGNDAGKVAREYITSYSSGLRYIKTGLYEYLVIF